MKYLILAIFAVTFVGGVSACKKYETGDCIKMRVNCTEAKMCYKYAAMCHHTKACYMNTTYCNGCMDVLMNCAKMYKCPDPFYFKHVIDMKCMGMTYPPMSGASALTGFGAMIVPFLVYSATGI